MTVRLTKDQKVKVLNSDDVFNIMQQILLRENRIRRAQEHFWIMGLNTRNKILFIELISLGPQNKMVVNPSDIFRMAIYKIAQKVILVHNHPSGGLKPSEFDVQMTASLILEGQILKIEVIDHLIITEDSFFSFEREGLIAGGTGIRKSRSAK